MGRGEVTEGVWYRTGGMGIMMEVSVEESMIHTNWLLDSYGLA